jgi:2-(1,2-epoxy-1,2-dihydrophenyl)acetyl-CoA isomerase
VGDEGVARLTLTRGERGNAFDLDLTEGLRLGALALAADASVRAVLLTAQGPRFSVGGDIEHFLRHRPDEYPELFGDLMDRVTEALETFAALDAPIVTAVHGTVAGAGLSLVGVADIVLAAHDTTFRTAFTGIGLPGDAGVSWFLPRLVGPRRAARLMLENTPFDATDALQWGLVSELVPATELQAAAEACAARLANGPTIAFGHLRRNLAAAAGSSLGEHLHRERASTVACAASPDLVDAVDAFAHHHRPTFHGRAS